MFRFSYRGRRIALAVASLLVILWTCTKHARAEAGPPIEAPVAQSDTDVAYPAGARGDAAVVLGLVVEVDGTVSNVEVVEGADPFGEHSRRAALTWRFSPARRGGRAVRARTRARVVFRQEETDGSPGDDAGPARAPTETDGGAAAAADAGTGGAPDAADDEVTVRGARREIGQTTMSAKDVREIPGAFGDPFRAVEVLPGVTPMLSGLSYFFVRGAPPNNSGYFIDGIRVPQLFHIGLGPGVIHPALLERVELHPGAAPVSFGRVSGGIVAGHTREPARELHGEANLRLVDVGAFAESPFADGRGTALAAFRYGYPGPIVGLFSDIDLGYWDYQTRATWRLGERDTLGLFAFGSHDRFTRIEEQGTRVDDFLSDFHRVDLRYDRAITGGRMRLAATLGYDWQGSAFDANAAPTYLTNKSAAVRFEVDRQLLSSLRARGGADVRLDAYGFEQPPPADRLQVVIPSAVDPPPTNVTSGAHADVVWRISPRVEVVPGARLDVYSSTRAGTTVTIPAVDPRIASRVTLARSVAWLSTVGLAHQYPALRVGGIQGMLVTGAGFPRGGRQLQTAAQTSQGVEIGLPGEVTLTATGFLSGWSGMTDLTADCIQLEPAERPLPGSGPGLPQPPQYVCPSSEPVRGHAYGLELLLRRSLSKRLAFWLAYTLSRSQRGMHFVTPQGGDAVATVPSEFDRTHVLNAIFAYDLGRRWRAGSRFVFYTGTPYSKLSGSLPVPPYHAFRDPPFFRVDVRLEKRWPIGQNGSIAFVVEGQNVTLSKETTGLGLDCVGEPTRTTAITQCKRSTIGPITIPSIGVEAFL